MIESGGEKNGRGDMSCHAWRWCRGEMDYYLPCLALVQGGDGLLLAMPGIGAGRDGLLLAMPGVGAGGDGLLLASGPSPHPIVCGIISYLCL